MVCYLLKLIGFRDNEQYNVQYIPHICVSVYTLYNKHVFAIYNLTKLYYCFSIICYISVRWWYGTQPSCPDEKDRIVQKFYCMDL